MGKGKKTVNLVKIGKLVSFFEKGRNGILSIEDYDDDAKINNTAFKEKFEVIFNSFKSKVDNIINKYEVKNCKVNLEFKSFKTEFYDWRKSDEINSFETNCKKYFAELYVKCINCVQFIRVSKRQYRPEVKEKGKEKPKKIDGETAQWATTVISRVLTAVAALVFTLALCGVIPKSALGITDENADAYFYIIDAAICLLPTGIVWLAKYIYDKRCSKYNVFDSMYQKYSTGRMKFMLYLCYPLKTRARDKDLASDILIWDECDSKYLNSAGYYPLDVSTQDEKKFFGVSKGKCVYISDKNLSAEVKNSVLSYNLDKPYINKNYWDVASLSQTFGTAIIVGDLLKSTTFEDEVLKKIKEKLIDYCAGYEERGTKDAIMAKSITDSLCGSDDKPVKEDVKSHLKKAKNRCYYFISAITYKHKDKNPTGEHTLDYLVAQKLVEKLGKDSVFWWENKLWKESSEWPISTRIATGLGFSTVFIGLAFDSVIKDGSTEDRYIYNCLFDDDRAYKTPAYFKHEVETFADLAKSKINSKRFVKGIVPKGQFKSLVPQKRYLRFYTLGQPNNGKYIDYPKFNGKGYVDVSDAERFRKIYTSKEGAEEKAEKIAEIIFKNLQKDDLIKPTQTAETPQEDKYAYLYAPFDSRFDDSNYCDDFLLPKWAGYEKYPWLNNIEKENIESVPSDYFFEYAIIDSENGKNARNHFLIFPENYNDGQGNLTWRLKLVVRDWNYAALVDGDFKDCLTQRELKDDEPVSRLANMFPLVQYDEISFSIKPNINSTNEYHETKITRRVYSNEDEKQRNRKDIGDNYNTGRNNNCSLILRDNALKKSLDYYCLTNGEITLNDSASTDNSKTFKFSIIFYPKKIIKYKVTKGIKNLIINFSDKVESGIKINCYFDNRAAINTGHARQLETNFKRITKYPYGEDEKTSINPQIIRLSISDDDIRGKYYLLLPEVNGGREHAPHRAKNIKCPCCGRIQTTKSKYKADPRFCYSKIENDTRKCQYNFIGLGYKVKGDEVDKDPILINDIIENLNSDVDFNLSKLQGGNQLVVDNSLQNNIIITMLGTSKSGKSTFISYLFDQGFADCFDGDSEENYNSKCNYLSVSLKPYVKEVSLSCIHIDDNSIKNCTKDEKYRKLGISGKCINEFYTTKRYEHVAEPTPHANVSEQLLLTHTPFVLEARGIQNNDSEGCFLSFFDVPGGAVEDDKCFTNKSIDYTMAFYSDCLIVLIDGTLRQLGTGIQTNFQKAADFLRRFKERAKEKIKVEDIKVAVVLAQFDKFTMNFLEESYARTSAPTARATKFKNSDRHKYINAASVEIEAYIEKNERGKEFLNVIDGFPHKFFAVSSVGRADSIIKKSEKETDSVFQTTPFNIENVLLWLMYEKGLIL